MRTTKDILEAAGLTGEEAAVMLDLISAWDRIVVLPVLQSDHMADYREAIHKAQRLIMVRPFIRVMQTEAGDLSK